MRRGRSRGASWRCGSRNPQPAEGVAVAGPSRDEQLRHLADELRKSVVWRDDAVKVVADAVLLVLSLVGVTRADGEFPLPQTERCLETELATAFAEQLRRLEHHRPNRHERMHGSALCRAADRRSAPDALGTMRTVSRHRSTGIVACDVGFASWAMAKTLSVRRGGSCKDLWFVKLNVVCSFLNYVWECPG